MLIGHSTFETNAKTKKGFSYTVSKGKVSIQKYIGKKSEVVIPDKIAGKKVTQIKAGAFSETKIKKIILPKYLKKVEYDQTYYEEKCIENKKNVVKTPFSDCPQLKNIHVKKNKYFKSLDGVLYSAKKDTLYCYPSAKKGKKYVVNKKTQKIAPGAFENTKIKTIVFNKKLKDIGDGAFFNCSLTSVDLSGNIDWLGNNVFNYSKKLKNVKIGKKLRYSRERYYGCTSLSKFNVDEGNKIFYSVDGVLYERDGADKYLICYPAAKKGDTFTIPADVKAGGRCFAYSKYLRKVVYDKNATLGFDFYCCDNMTVVLPINIFDPVAIGDYDGNPPYDDHFYGCKNMILYGSQNEKMQLYAKSKGFVYNLI